MRRRGSLLGKRGPVMVQLHVRGPPIRGTRRALLLLFLSVCREGIGRVRVVDGEWKGSGRGWAGDGA